MGPSGVLLYRKPAGVTSHDVVSDVRRRLGGASHEGGRRFRVGHAGTLDPFATGLLLVLAGRATRVARFVSGLPKTYRAVARLGWRSDTGDRDGTLARGRVPAELRLPAGEILQRPPAFSAVRVDGERLYERARRGDPVEGPPRRVTVHRAEALWHEGERAAFEIECSAGTYVRQLIAGLGDAYCEELERTRVGPFRLEDADPERVIPLREALAFLPEKALTPAEAEAASHGRAAPGGGAAELANGLGAVRLTMDGELVAIAEPRGSELKPVVVLAS